MMSLPFCSSFVSANWFNLHDTESGIHKVEISMGTSPGDQDILSARLVHGATMATFVPDTVPAVDVTYYTTLKVWNNAGIHSSHTTTIYN